MQQKSLDLDHKVNDSVHNLDAFRQIGDDKADHLVEHLMTSGQPSELYNFLKAESWQDVVDLQIKDQQFTKFIYTGNELPDWANLKKMNNASALFRSNGNEFLFMLGIVSLPYCYAAAKGAIALYHTEKIRKNTEKRLLDTTSFIIDIMRKEAFANEGHGFLVVKQVRLRHAVARYHLQNIEGIKKLNEMPVNQEDMAGTNLAFSYVALKAMPLIGVNIPTETQNDYLHFWGVIGFLLGLNSDLVALDLKSAFWLEKRIAHRQFRSSAEGLALTEKLVSHYKDQIPNKMTTLMIKPLMRRLLGDEIAKIIGLEGNVKFNPLDKVMALLPIFKKYIFPPVQSFEDITKQIHLRQKQFADK